jgi:hypothetical protein
MSIALSLGSGSAGPVSEVLGQVTPKQGHLLPDEIRAVAQCGDTQVEASVSRSGEFALHDLPGDLAEVALHAGDTRVRLNIPRPNSG